MKQPNDGTFSDSQVVDEFVERFYNSEVRLRLEAQAVMFSNNKVTQSLTNLLSEAITNYTLAKSGLKALYMLRRKTKQDSALTQVILEQYNVEKYWRAQCLKYITYAKNNDLIVETESITYRLKKSEQENEQLKSENLVLKKRNKELENENKRLSQIFPDSRKGNTEYGDLEKP